MRQYLLSAIYTGCSAIGDIETFDDSRLRRNFAFYQCGGQCKALTIEHSFALERSCCGKEGRKADSCGIYAGKPAKKPCWGSMAPLRRRSRRRRAMEKGVGRKSVASDGHTTDAVYSLQAGKTVDISRQAAESTDLLSAFSTASATLWPTAAPPTRPAAGRLAAAAAHRAAGEDIGDNGGGDDDCC